MTFRTRRLISVLAVISFAVFGIIAFSASEGLSPATSAQTDAKPSPTPLFDQPAAIAALKEQIKGKEGLPAGEVFKNVKDYAQFPAERLLAIMEFGYARSLGVDCTHCHTPDNWASDEKRAKGIAREMKAMSIKINDQILPSIKAFAGREGRDRPVVSCTTCHRGQIIPATSLGKG